MHYDASSLELKFTGYRVVGFDLAIDRAPETTRTGELPDFDGDTGESEEINMPPVSPRHMYEHRTYDWISAIHNIEVLMRDDEFRGTPVMFREFCENSLHSARVIAHALALGVDGGKFRKVNGGWMLA